MPASKILLLLFAALSLLITLISLASIPPQHASTPLFNALSLQNEAPTNQTPPLRYKAPKKSKHPFLDLYQEQTPLTYPAQPHNMSHSTIKDPPPFFTSYNTDQHTENPFFVASSPRQQPLQEGKPIELLLKEPIPALQLPQGTLLKGSPAFQGNRVFIHITAASLHRSVRPLKLLCFDPNDCMEGLFYDSNQHAIDTQIASSLLHELLELQGTTDQQRTKSARLPQYFNPPCFLEKGRELLLALPPHSKKP
mgnify:CR=1 FL=1